MRSPISVWRRRNSHSIGVERLGLLQDLAGDRDLADVVQLGGGGDALDRLVVEPELARRGGGQQRDGSPWALSSASHSPTARSSTLLLWASAEIRPLFFSAYSRRSATRSASDASTPSAGMRA